DPDVPLLWRFRRSMAGGGIAIDTGYHLVDCARFLIGEIDAIQGLTTRVIAERRLPSSGAIGNRGGGQDGADATMGTVDVEDAAAALVWFASGAYGILETSRVAIGKRVSLQVELFGSRGSADWDLERPDEFRVCLPGEAATFGYRRVLVSPAHPGATELLIGGTDGTSIGWLGQECAMWAEFLTAIAERRPAHADFVDGVIANTVIDALYASAATGARTPVLLPDEVSARTEPAVGGSAR
ncbi:MAG TPA: Gfo/Idh/MocA family oxidoreductase, partial [Candidatus Saccharimonadia bacterium]|nr:Gfo/Idh/MocA family oxidoreductase [Candidatus Saccharimonadia bacterium]